MNTIEKRQVFNDCIKEMTSFCKSLHLQDNEEECIASLQSLQVKINKPDSDSLLILMSLLPSVTSTQALRNIMRLFLRKISHLIEELNVLKNDVLAKHMLNIVKDFWSLFSNQHVVITQMTFGKYSPLVYEVLPSFSSVYVDLFITVYSTKSTADKASKRLHSWLTFELNERAIKTALLEVCQCTETGARLLLPLLRKLLSKPPDNTSNLDYLLHFILLRRWTLVSMDLHDLLQKNVTVKAPRNFPDWLAQYWPQASNNLPSDKSLQGRRVSELLLELDQQAVEELIDVFSQCLWSAEQESEKRYEQTSETAKSTEQGMADVLFIIDKKGNDREEVCATDDLQPLKKKKKLWHNEKDCSNISLLSTDTVDYKQRHNESDIFMLSGLLDGSHSLGSNGSKKENSVLDNCKQDASYESESDEISNKFTVLKGYDEENCTLMNTRTTVAFANASEISQNEPEITFIDLSSPSYVVSSSDEEDDIIVLSNASSQMHSSSFEKLSTPNRKQKTSTPTTVPALLHNNPESQDNNRSAGNSHSKIQKTLASESIETMNDEDGAANKNYKNITGYRVGLALSEIRKLMDDKRKLVSKDIADNSFSCKIKTKSEGMTLRQRNTSTEKATVRGLSDWLRKSPSRLSKEQPSPRSVMKKSKKNDLPFPQLLQYTKVKGTKSTAATSTKELHPADISGSYLKTYSTRDQRNIKINHTNEDEKTHQSKYFLRTNCSHRLLRNETMCSTCSPKKMMQEMSNL